MRHQEHSNRVRPIVIGIAGGSGSGKTYLANELARQIGEENVLVISMDRYFASLDDPRIDPYEVNFDHPGHLDLQLLITHLRKFKEGKNVFLPSYDFNNMTRMWATNPQQPKPIIIVEGLFVLGFPIRQSIDFAYFLDVEADERLLGRIMRDIQERNASVNQVIDRYQRFVRPSYEVFVKPTRQNADLVIDFTFRRSMLTQLIANTLRDFLNSKMTTDEFVQSIRHDRFMPGVAGNASFMPMSLDLELLARTYPEKTMPIDSSRIHLASAAFGGAYEGNLEEAEFRSPAAV